MIDNDRAFRLIEAGEEREFCLLVFQGRLNVNARSDAGHTLLSRAAHNGLRVAVKQLLLYGADVNGGDGRSPLLYAASAGHANVVEELLLGGVNVRFSDSRGFNLLHLAAMNDHVNVLQTLLDHPEIDDVDDLMNVEAADGDTPLAKAIKKRAFTFAEAAIRYELVLPTYYDRNGNGYLHLAIASQNRSLVQALCEVLDDERVMARNTSDLTPLDVARVHRNEGIIDVVASRVGRRHNYSAARCGRPSSAGMRAEVVADTMRGTSSTTPMVLTSGVLTLSSTSVTWGEERGDRERDLEDQLKLILEETKRMEKKLKEKRKEIAEEDKKSAKIDEEIAREKESFRGSQRLSQALERELVQLRSGTSLRD
mmetsp:Transcript_32199/g.83671  ORF Transcript_32199/g.83671 Transcript_32199/m.83671 type:complete len:368 (-) Transcript_32199:13-1116(-)